MLLRPGGAENEVEVGEGERGCAEMQIFARKLITRINSSQNIQTGCQTVRLHTPTHGAASQTPHIPPPPPRCNGCTYVRGSDASTTDTMRILLVRRYSPHRRADYGRICRAILFQLVIKSCQ